LLGRRGHGTPRPALEDAKKAAERAALSFGIPSLKTDSPAK
jgi:hypothetical protein